MSTQSDMSDKINCSEGARMLIERMQSHPEDFRPGGRFVGIAEQVMGLAPRGYQELSDRDDTALSLAYDQYVLEPQLTEYVVDEIFNGDKRRTDAMQQDIKTMYSKALAGSMMATKNAVSSSVINTGFNDARVLWQGPAPDNSGLVRKVYPEPPSAGRIWLEDEKKRLRGMTDRALTKLKGKSK